MKQQLRSSGRLYGLENWGKKGEKKSSRDYKTGEDFGSDSKTEEKRDTIILVEIMRQ